MPAFAGMSGACYAATTIIRPVSLAGTRLSISTSSSQNSNANLMSRWLLTALRACGFTNPSFGAGAGQTSDVITDLLA